MYKKTDIVKGHKISGGKFNSTLRPVQKQELNTTKSSDPTSSLDILIAETIDYYSHLQPAIFHFSISKNDNSKLTPANGIIDLSIPIIPICFNTNSRVEMEEFMKAASTPASLENKLSKIPENEIEDRIEGARSTAMNYILFALGERYNVAKQSNDQKTMDQIANLAVIKENEFDLELCSMVIEKKKTKDQLSRAHYAAGYNFYVKTEAEYDRLLNILNRYSYYDIQQEINQENIKHTKDGVPKVSKESKIEMPKIIHISNEGQPGEE